MEKRIKRSSLNLAAAGWFIDKNGFLLTDALVSVFIVSVLASLTAAALIGHYHVSESIHHETQELEERDEQVISQIGVCEICENSPLPSEITEESY